MLLILSFRVKIHPCTFSVVVTIHKSAFRVAFVCPSHTVLLRCLIRDEFSPKNFYYLTCSKTKEDIVHMMLDQSKNFFCNLFFWKHNEPTFDPIVNLIIQMSLLGDVPWPWKYNKPNLLFVVDLVLQISLMGKKTPRQYNSVPRRPPKPTKTN